MPYVVPRKVRKHSKANDDDSLLPAFQQHITGGMDSIYTIPMNPSPASNSIGGGKTLYFDLERDECSEINDLCFEFNITCSTASVELAPFPYILERLVIESSKGIGDTLKTCYPEEWFIWNQITLDEEARNKWSELTKWKIVKSNQDNSERIWINDKTKLQPGKSYKCYLPVPALFFHLDSVDMRLIRSDVRFRFEMAQSSQCIVSGDANNLSLDSINLLVRSFNEETYDRAEREMQQKKTPHKYIYNDVERLQINDKTLTAGSTLRISTDSFVGKSGMLAVFIKPSTNPIASDKSIFNFVDLSKNTKWDITNSAGQSLIGNGTSISQEYLDSLFNTHTGNPHLQGITIIPFTEDIKKNFAGVLNGIFEYTSLHDYIEITFANAPVQEVQTITTESLGTTGSYKLAFEDVIISSTDLDYDATTSEIKTSLESIPKCKELNLSVSVSAGLDDNTTQTYTFGTDNGAVNEELGKLTYIGNQTPKVSTSSITTYGEKGFTSGSNYQITILMYKFKCLNIDKNGNITCKDM